MSSVIIVSELVSTSIRLARQEEDKKNAFIPGESTRRSLTLLHNVWPKHSSEFVCRPFKSGILASDSPAALLELSFVDFQSFGTYNLL